MTKKLEETLGLPPLNESLSEFEEEAVEDDSNNKELLSIDDLKETMYEVDKINQALKPVKDLESLDSDMDKYASRAMEAFEELMTAAVNVEDRHAGDIFDAASKMMNNALTAKTAKMDRKLKVIQMQMQQRRLDLDEKKLQHKIESDNRTPDDDELSGTGTVVDRATLLSEVMKEIKKDKKNNATDDK